ncbi:cytochrome P450 [Talaromyces pinophilus]|uniref:Cytochrome P450 n=1 Tax=Talaromyces pinophilus TaxID=128442 RepID=A0A6V8H0H7_TALPI|nr:cytochrome P450 [Talaromyces pinophilus]
MAIVWLDSTKNELTKTDWYDMVLPRTSTIFTRDEDEHTARRRLWDHALSVRNTNNIHIPRTLHHIKALHEFIDKANGEPILVNDMMAWYTFDAMGDLVYGQDFEMLKTGKWRPVVKQQQRALALLAPINDTIWIVRLAFAFAPFYGKIREFFKIIDFCDQRMAERIQSGAKKDDLASYFIEEYHALDGQRSLKERKALLSGNAVSAVIAGSDTTNPALTAVSYFLAKNPKDAEKVYQELQGIDVTDSIVLANLPHLNGVINETLRLFPPAMTINTRVTPSQGLWFDDTFIPGGIRVVAPKYTIMRSSEAFEDGASFIPERWYSRPEMVRIRAAFAPFGSGHRQCAGKHLALVQLRLVISSIVQKYILEFPPGFDAESVEKNLKDQVTCRPGPCWVVYKPRVSEMKRALDGNYSSII